MLEIFRFYMPTRWTRPIFGSNGAAADVWMMFVFAAGALLGLFVVAVAGRLTLTTALVLGGLTAVFVALSRVSLPEARRLYEIDRIVRQQEQEGRSNAESWMRRQPQK